MGCGPLQFICGALGGAVSSVASTGFDAIAQSFGEAASTLCEWMWSAISQTSTVDLTGDWFTADQAITLEIASSLVTALFVIQVIKGALSRDPRTLGHAISGAGIACIGSAAAILVTETLLVLTDHLSDGIVQSTGRGDLSAMGKKLTPVGLLAGSGFTPALVVTLSMFFVIACVLVWAVFIVRKAMIIVAAVFAPITFGGAAADATRAWVRRWIEFTLSMILSKVVIVLIFTIAVSLIGQATSDTTGLSNLMTGLLLLVLACFSPWMVFKMVHYVGGDLIAAHHSGMVSDTKAAAGTVSAVGATARNAAQKTFASSGSADAQSAGGGSATPASTAVAPSTSRLVSGSERGVDAATKAAAGPSQVPKAKAAAASAGSGPPRRDLNQADPT
jgi:hypothetical protein